MKRGMEAAPKTGDPSLDFLYEMIPHHEAAVSMSENILKYGHNEQVKQLAANIIRDQLAGIGKLEALKEKLIKNPQINKQAEEAYLKTYTLQLVLKTQFQQHGLIRPDRPFLLQLVQIRIRKLIKNLLQKIKKLKRNWKIRWLFILLMEKTY